MLCHDSPKRQEETPREATQKRVRRQAGEGGLTSAQIHAAGIEGPLATCSISVGLVELQLLGLT